MPVLKTFEEGTAVTVTATFRTTSGGSFTPTTVHYALRNETANASIVDWTSVTPASSVEISISATYISLNDQTNNKETFEVTIVADKDTSTQVVKTKKFAVSNVQAL